ncbi:MAG: DUF4164 family protein [Cyanobacterium sp. T60_A2020_053]|nr:DUF4164 family protein [Cyanobacterium sp. T60_A2020_053]
MNQIIEVNIADILARLESKMDRFDQKIDQVEQRLEAKLNKLDESIDHLDQKFEVKLDKLSNEVNQVKVDIAKVDEKVTGVGKRLDNLEFIARTVGAGIVVALLLALARYLFPDVSL